MLDDLFDTFTERSRDKRGKSSGGLLGRLGQLLEGDFDGERRQERDHRRDDRDERARYATSRQDDRLNRDRDDDDDDFRPRDRSQKRRDFDFDFGD